jgi:hypothetical protein
LRVRLGKPLTSDATSILLKYAGRTLELKSQKLEEPLRQAKWVLFIAKGFETEESARSFGEELRTQVEIAALSCGVGVDTGENQPSSWMNEDWARGRDLIGKDERIVPNIHGLLIVPDDDNSKIPLMEGKGFVTADPDLFIGAIEELSVTGVADLASCTARVRLLNFALMSAEPLAKAALAFSAVEALGQDEVWSERQKARLKELANSVEQEALGNDIELLEISEALRRSLHRVGLIQGVKRALDRLELSFHKRAWDRLYTLRSGVFHGTKSLSKHELAEFANEALELCAKIVMEDVRSRGQHIPEVFRKRFGTAE